MAQEIELKLRMSVDSIDALANYLDQGAGAGEVIELGNDYFDTHDIALAKARAALRIRRSAKGVEQTLKTRGYSQGGLQIRNEWNWPLLEPCLNLEKLASPEVSAYLPEPFCHESLALIFSTNFQRRRWLLTPGGASRQIEVVIDYGSIKTNVSNQSLCEIELELQDGEPEDLWQLVFELQDQAALWLSDISKAERGYVLAKQSPAWQLQNQEMFTDWNDFLSFSLNSLQRSIEYRVWDDSDYYSLWHVGYPLWVVTSGAIKAATQSLLIEMFASPDINNQQAAYSLCQLSYLIYRESFEPQEPGFWREKLLDARKESVLPANMYDIKQCLNY